MADTGYVAGYLSMSIPMIAYMLVNKGGMMMASLAGGVMSGIQGIAARAADEATTGNISLGNNSQDNINWFKNDTSVLDNRGYGTNTGADGLQQRITDSGGRFENSPISAAANQQTVSSLRSGHSMSVESANQSGSAFVDSLGAAHADMTRLSNAISSGTVNTDGWSQSARQEFSENWS